MQMSLRSNVQTIKKLVCFILNSTYVIFYSTNLHN